MKMESLVGIGMILILIGFIAIFVGALAKSENTKVAVGGFIGFIPFGFGNDKRLVWIVVGISAFAFMVWAIFNLRISR